MEMQKLGKLVYSGCLCGSKFVTLEYGLPEFHTIFMLNSNAELQRQFCKRKSMYKHKRSLYKHKDVYYFFISKEYQLYMIQFFLIYKIKIITKKRLVWKKADQVIYVFM